MMYAPASSINVHRRTEPVASRILELYPDAEIMDRYTLWQLSVPQDECSAIVCYRRPGRVRVWVTVGFGEDIDGAIAAGVSKCGCRRPDRADSSED